jgi:hypothetical protein
MISTQCQTQSTNVLIESEPNEDSTEYASYSEDEWNYEDDEEGNDEKYKQPQNINSTSSSSGNAAGGLKNEITESSLATVADNSN